MRRVTVVPSSIRSISRVAEVSINTVSKLLIDAGRYMRLEEIGEIIGGVIALIGDGVRRSGKDEPPSQISN